MSGGRRLLARVLVALLGIALFTPALSAISARAAHADPASEESQFIALTNQLRAAKGLSQLAVSPEVTAVARRWAAQMAAAGTISHNQNLPNQVTLNWTKLGENVGTGGAVEAIQTAFINSPKHYENLVDPVWNYIGIGVVDSNGRIFVTVNFMQLSGSVAVAPKASAPAPRATPRTTTAPKPAAVPTPAPVTVPPQTAPVPARTTVPAARTVDASPALQLAINQLRALDENQ
jgi:uncharacterized protein YkwD